MRNNNTWLGAEGPFDAPEYEEILEAGSISCTLTQSGKYSALESAKPTPDGTAVVPGTAITLRQSRLIREEGEAGKLILTGRDEIADDDTDADAPDTVRIRLTWTPRQVPIERGRVASLGSNYDYALLEYWKRTEDHRLKKAFKAVVPVLYGDTPAELTPEPADSIYSAARVEIHELDADTKAIAQRIAIGMESYEDWYPVITITKTWTGKPPAASLVTPGTQGDPPAFPPGVTLSDYAWICSAADIEQTDVKKYTTANSWTGLLSASVPDPEPAGWGSTPFDAKYYGPAPGP